MRARLVTAAGGALALAVALGACTENTGQDDDVLDPNQVRTGAIATDPADSKGPAPEVPGATQGGTFHILRESKISHLDPQRAYSFAGLMGSQLYARALTAFTDDGKGNVTLVGDLAETPGANVDGDCKVWEFKIKDGVKFEDGSRDHQQGDRVRDRPLVQSRTHRRPDLPAGVAGRHRPVRHRLAVRREPRRRCRRG